MSHPFFELPKPVIIGHRGAAGEAPENTIRSFRRALDCGAVILETDMHVTRDGEPVLCHDASVDRTTDGSGAISDLTLSDLKELDAGHHFLSALDHSHPFRGRGIKIPTLNEALKSFPGARFNIEIKAHDSNLISRILFQLRENRREELTLLTAAETDTMRLLRQEINRTGSRVALGASRDDVAGYLRALVQDSSVPVEVMALQIPCTFQGFPILSSKLIELAHAHGAHVHVWTINDPKEMDELLKLGVDGIVTDYPGRMHTLVTRNYATT